MRWTPAMDRLALAGKVPEGVSPEAAARRLRRLRKPDGRKRNCRFVPSRPEQLYRDGINHNKVQIRPGIDASVKAEARQVPAVHTSRSRGESYLIISDTQEPYAADGSIAFCLAVAREFGIDVGEPGRVLHVGDEADAMAFSRFLRSPEAPHTVNQELAALRERMAAWYRAFPFVRVCRSNHGDRLIKRAAEVGLPQQVLRAWRELLEAPPGWEWAPNWTVKASRSPFLVEHGHQGPSGVASLRTRPALNGISTAWGHTHAQPGIAHVQTAGQRVWGLCVGSLIDRDAVAFEYGRGATWHPVNGVGVILDGGRTPIWIPWGGQWP